MSELHLSEHELDRVDESVDEHAYEHEDDLLRQAPGFTAEEQDGLVAVARAVVKAAASRRGNRRLALLRRAHTFVTACREVRTHELWRRDPFGAIEAVAACRSIEPGELTEALLRSSERFARRAARAARGA